MSSLLKVTVHGTTTEPLRDTFGSIIDGTGFNEKKNRKNGELHVSTEVGFVISLIGHLIGFFVFMRCQCFSCDIIECRVVDDTLEREGEGEQQIESYKV